MKKSNKEKKEIQDFGSYDKVPNNAEYMSSLVYAEFGSAPMVHHFFLVTLPQSPKKRKSK